MGNAVGLPAQVVSNSKSESESESKFASLCDGAAIGLNRLNGRAGGRRGAGGRERERERETV